MRVKILLLILAVLAALGVLTSSASAATPYHKVNVYSTLSLCKSIGSDGYRYHQWGADYYCSRELAGYGLWVH